MPLRGLLRSPRVRPRKERRDRSARRSSCRRNSGESRFCARAAVGTLSLVQSLEVLFHLPVVVARDLLAGDVLLHLFAVLSEHAQVLQARGHLAAAPDHVRIDTLLAPRPRLSLDPHVIGVAAQALRRIALGAAALALARQRAFALREVALVARGSSLSAIPAAAAAPVVLAAAAEALAVAPPLLHRAQLVERPLHGFHGLVALALLERLHALAEITLVARVPSAAQPLHLLHELAELVGRELIAPQASAERLCLLEYHALLALREVALEVRQAVDLLEHPDPVVAPLQERVEIGRLVGERRVLEDRRQVAGLRGGARARTGAHRLLLHLGAADVVALRGRRPILALEAAAAILRLHLVLLTAGREIGQRALRQRNGRRQGERQAQRKRHRHEPRLARNAPRDDSAALECLDPRHGVGHEGLDQRSAIRPSRPFERRGDAVLQTVTAVGEPSGLLGRHRNQETRDRTRDRADAQTRARPGEACDAEGV